MDGFLLALLITGSLGIYFFPKLFIYYERTDNALDFVGMLCILKGCFIRMSARGHKLSRSPQGQGLAADGLYAYIRNPMYLGTFLIATGFILVLWPWWMVFVFGILFYLRFNPLICSEEKHLKTLFGKTYEDYCHRVPRFFPSVGNILNINKKMECPWTELWSTKERRTIWLLPLAALAGEAVQEMWLYHRPPDFMTFGPLLAADVIFAFHLYYEYFLKYGKITK